MQAIADWLEKLGMSEYAERFADNRIDFTVLPEPTDQDLKDLGVVLGDRRKMLRAIADLGDTPAAAAPAPAPASALAPTAVPAVEAVGERRQVTVMFSDLVGSTALSASMDPEDLREVISSYQKCVAENVRRFGGFVAKYMGDGVLVYFGYPQAHDRRLEYHQYWQVRVAQRTGPPASSIGRHYKKSDADHTNPASRPGTSRTHNRL
jgi:hypothetical protein